MVFPCVAPEAVGGGRDIARTPCPQHVRDVVLDHADSPETPPASLQYDQQHLCHYIEARDEGCKGVEQHFLHVKCRRFMALTS